MYIITVRDINNNMVAIAKADTLDKAQKIQANIAHRYNFPVFVYYNEIKGFACSSIGGRERYNGIDKIDISNSTENTANNIESIADYEKRIFLINMQDYISENDYRLIDGYNNRIKELRGE